ncbi:MAG: DMT family transporter [Promethearchaeota archaeon]|nr:MAG: DMT family transporter [Candidatus Lokiarchaeota archaeon]
MTIDINKKVLLKGYFYALIAALLFGLSTPISKILLTEIDPITLSGWSYIFSGLFLLPGLKYIKKEKYLNSKDLLKISLIIIFGSILGPIFVLIGLANSSAFQASLFLNFEVVFTVLIAILVFKEKITIKNGIGIILIIVLLFSWSINFKFFDYMTFFSVGVSLIVLGCLFWAIDNNITRTLEGKSSIMITMIKSLCGGIITIFIAIILQINIFLSLSQFLIVFIFGVLTFGISIACFITALKYIGTIKAGIILALSPFISAILSIIINQETISLVDLIIFFLVFFGLVLITLENPEKLHGHHFIIHAHSISKEDVHHKDIKILNIEGNKISHVHKPIKHSHSFSHDSMHEEINGEDSDNN